MHNFGQKNLHKLTNLLIAKILNTEKTYIACGVATEMRGQTLRMFASKLIEK